MNDRNLLELAAKAIGHVVARETDDGKALLLVGMQQPWNPLTDDGDALRLAVKLKLDLCRPSADAGVVSVWVDRLSDFVEERLDADPYAATRRAIVRGAAAMSEAG